MPFVTVEQSGGDHMALDFVAMDFETANEKRASACAVALVFFKGGCISRQYKWLIRPPRHLDYFNPINSRIHGITNEDVVDKPRFDGVWQDINGLLDQCIVVAHNASFDISVLRQSLDVYGLEHPNMEFVCTRNVAKKTWDKQAGYSLKNIASQLGYKFHHHDPLDDAKICGRILVEACSHHGCSSIKQLARKIDMRTGRLYGDFYRPCSVSNPFSSVRKRNHDTLKISDLIYKNAGGSKVFKGKTLAFTGTLVSMTRQQAAQLVVNNAGSVSTTVTKRTNYLVMGVQDYSRFADGKQSRKTKRARELMGAGQSLEIIDESQFLKMLSLGDGG